VHGGKKSYTERKKMRREKNHLTYKKMIDDLKNAPITKEMVEVAGDKSKLEKIRKDIVESGVMRENQTRNEVINEFFREQVDDELEKAERAKRIDERL